jgi:Flp pilus assembly protein TadD
LPKNPFLSVRVSIYTVDFPTLFNETSTICQADRMITQRQRNGGAVRLPDEGSGAPRMKRFDAAASTFLAVGLLVLGGCEQVPMTGMNSLAHVIDPLTINGRDGGGQPLDYATLMRIGAAAQAGGDAANAVAIFRRAAAIAPGVPAPFVAAGNALLEMGQVAEATVAYSSALTRNGHDPEALRGLARAYMMTGKPELAGQPLSVAYRDTPNDPKLLQLIGVADDLAGQHEEAQARYRRGLELLPHDRALSLNLALSLALTATYAEAVAILRPIATAVTSSPRERQTLALIYGLQGNRRAAEHMARLDLDGASVVRNLAYFETLRRLSPQARQRAIQANGAQTSRTAAANAR